MVWGLDEEEENLILKEESARDLLLATQYLK
jgi:hypothetical protein